MTTSHLSFERLADLVEDRLDAISRKAALEHVGACSSCASDFEQLGNVLALMRTDRETDAPRDLLAYASEVFQRRVRPSTASVLKRLVAVLTFDSFTMKPEFAVRSGSSSTRQLLFSAEGNDLDLRIAPVADGRAVSGQLLGAACAGGEVELRGPETKSASLNELCEFTLPVVRPGNYSLRLKLSDIEIEVPDLEL